MKSYLIAISFFLFPFVLSAQYEVPLFGESPIVKDHLITVIESGESFLLQAKCDSLLQTDINEKTAGILHCYLAEVDLIEDLPSEAMDHLTRANSLFEASDDGYGLAYTNNQIGLLVFNHGKTDEAISYFHQARRQAQQLEHHDLLFEIAQNESLLYSHQQQNEAAMQSLSDALHHALKSKNKKHIKTAYNQISTNYYAMGELDSSIMAFEKLIDLTPSDDLNGLNDLSTLAKLYRENGDYSRAQNLLIKALRQAEAKKDTIFMMTLHSDIAKIYSDQKQWEKAMEYSKQALAFAKLNGVQLVLAQNLELQGHAAVERDQNEEALQKYQLALKEYEQLNNTIRIADIKVAIANLYQRTNDFDLAYEAVKEAQQLRRVIDDPIGSLNTNLLLAQLELKRRNYKKAIALLQETQAKSEKKALATIYKDACWWLSQAHEMKGDFSTALTWYKKYDALNDTLFSEQTTRIINEVELAYETEKKDNALTRQEAQLDKQNADLQKQRIQLFALLLTLALLAVLGGTLYFLFKQKQQLQAQNLAVLKKEQETNVLQAVIKGEEQERERVARELHDGLGAHLATVRMRIEALTLNTPQLKENPSYQKAQDLIDNACSSVRQISHSMVPSFLEKNGLEYAVRDTCEAMEQANNLNINFIYFAEDESLLNTNQNFTIFRIVQELLRNVVIHSGATEALLQLNIEAPFIRLTLEDNGKGFHVEAAKKSGMGLSNVKSRVAYLNGDIEIHSTIGEGASFNIEIPIET